MPRTDAEQRESARRLEEVLCDFEQRPNELVNEGNLREAYELVAATVAKFALEKARRLH